MRSFWRRQLKCSDATGSIARRYFGDHSTNSPRRAGPVSLDGEIAVPDDFAVSRM